MNLPSRRGGWDVSGQALSMQGLGADVVIHWVPENDSIRHANQLLGFSSHGELPSLVIHSTDKLKQAQMPDTSLDKLLSMLANDLDLRARYRYYSTI